MFQPLSLFVGLRYVRARTRKFFVSFITWTSLAGVCVGVASLIVILSVMNGLENELRDQLVSLSAHARVVVRADVGQHAALPSEAQWQNAQQAIRAGEGVVGVARYVEIQALAVRTPEMVPVLLRGIDPRAEGAVTEVARAVTQGSLRDLAPGSDKVIVGAVIAEQLGLAPGDSLTVLVPAISADGAPSPKLRELTVAGEFEVGRAEHDGTLIFGDIDDVRALSPGGAAGEGLRIRFRDALEAPALAARLRATLPPQFELFDWTQDNASYFRAVRIEKTMMSIILMMIVGVATFNIVSMLVMVVTDKRTDIAILRTLGASPRRIMGVFVTQGLVIGWLGVVLGLTVGLSVALNIDTVVPFLEHTFHFQIFDSDVYYMTRIPADVRWPGIVIISVCALLLTGLATLYPAIRASRTAPAEALRYE
ncbi:MAG TPA: lipoprotein-releasing ABC transporter permease subunit [Steroidobacteraceae bacterium]|nr:lipoprotein-releasing ABC transporter permease subunit [Steroidobacteraceae bacterium]